jgi:hypothetical protein
LKVGARWHLLPVADRPRDLECVPLLGRHEQHAGIGPQCVDELLDTRLGDGGRRPGPGEGRRELLETFGPAAPPFRIRSRLMVGSRAAVEALGHGAKQEGRSHEGGERRRFGGPRHGEKPSRTQGEIIEPKSRDERREGHRPQTAPPGGDHDRRKCQQQGKLRPPTGREDGHQPDGRARGACRQCVAQESVTCRIAVEFRHEPVNGCEGRMRGERAPQANRSNG